MSKTAIINMVRGKIARSVLPFLGVIFSALFIYDDLFPGRTWVSYLQVMDTLALAILIVVDQVKFYLSERGSFSLSEFLLLTGWLILILGAAWKFFPVVFLGGLIILISRTPSIASYFRSVFVNLAKSYREISKQL